MVDIQITKLRKSILKACDCHHGILERKWDADATAVKAIEYMIKQGLLKREVGDDNRSFVYRLITTDRGRSALRGEIVTQL